ncbi:hypothetical protein QU593_09935 [Rossellomorea marisflavi]|uniref:hypothetical protein n=1 Tax=Rossellomorea marisflavi TaxID=189381 RepID=UPI0025AF84F6|nr:hypothetical protein [Rossellomorea marisflavi]WJV20723.1 hypothetical protein QU593_09935 [Rossellomorea marisflavi]
MKKQEKEMMINEFQKQFQYYLLSGEESEVERTLLQGERRMMKLFFTNKEINLIENNVRVTSDYIKECFLVIESWLRQIEKEQGETELLFTWDLDGLNKVYSHYDWLLKEYKELGLALNNTYRAFERVA